MSILKEIQRLPSTKTALRKFGVTVGIAFGLLGGLFLWHGKSYAMYFLIPAAVLIILGLLVPAILRPVYYAWMTLAFMMGWVMTRVILSIVFFLIVTPLGWLLKIIGKDVLHLRIEKDKASHWIQRPERSKESYFRQF